MGLADQPAQPKPDQGSVRPNARRPAGGDIRAGVDAGLLCSAITTGGPLPDDHAAAAVWWRISRHLTPTVTAQADTGHTFTTVRSTRLTELIGADRADSLQSSRWWPALVTAVDHALQRGWRLDDLLGAAGMPDAGSGMQPRRWFGASRCWPTQCPPTSPASRPLAPPLWTLEQRRAAVREIAFGARDDITTRPADTTERC